MSLIQIGRRNSITHFQQHYHRMFLKLTCVQRSVEQKSNGIVFRKDSSQHISDQLKENLTIPVLAGELLSSYNCKRLALSLESATQPKQKKCIPLTS